MACACFRNACYVSGGREVEEEEEEEEDGAPAAAAAAAEEEMPLLKASGSQSVCEQKVRTSTPASLARAWIAESRARA